MKSTLDPLGKKLIFHLNPELLKPSPVFPARPAASSAARLSSAACRQLLKLSEGEISSHILFEQFFSLRNVANKDYFSSGLANTISYLAAYWEYNWKKHDKVLQTAG